MKKQLLSIILIFSVWSTLDWLLHGKLLMAQYLATASLWRPADQMQMGFMHLSTLIITIIFVLIFDRFFKFKNTRTGFVYGLLYGIAGGVGMGFGCYSCMPIPLTMALSWLGGVVVECVLAGLIVGFFMRGPN